MQLTGSISSSLEWKSTVETAQRWVLEDPNETTATYIERLIAGDDVQKKELKVLFPDDKKRIAFGTAGLRSCMKPGPLHMNDLVVVQTAQGIARYCQNEFTAADSCSTGSSVVIGYDHRANAELNLSSLSFALLTALVFNEAGFDDCFLMDGFVATPFVPFAVNHQCKLNDSNCIGIMITASHNPKEDAGYKVYWKNGCQIRSPIDAGMAISIEENLKPWTNYRQKLDDLKSLHPNNPCLGLSDPKRTSQIINSYFHAIQTSGLVSGNALEAVKNSVLPQNPPRFCYSAMHGIGHKYAKRAFEEVFGLPSFCSVVLQQEPDPTFPTVPFPNPEEKGALDLAKEFACMTGCDVIMANDPDADRLAVAEKCRQTGQWTVFTGDQIGVMLGHWLWEIIGKKEHTRTIAMCASTVSSKMLAEIARVEGFYFEDTLTGFKWIGSRASELHNSRTYRTIFCYEEAIGFCCGDVVFDKDGITALCVFAELSMWVYSQSPNSSLRLHMQNLYDKYGEFVSRNGYYFLHDFTVVKRIFDRITNNGCFDTLDYVGSYKVASVRYLGRPGYDSSQPDKKPRLPTSESAPMLTIFFENGCVVHLRGSGTEPKFKYYIELKGKPGVPREVVATDLESMSTYILETLLEPSRHSLIKIE